MEQRLNVYEKGLTAMKRLYALGLALSTSRIEPKLLDLVFFRVSQINGCAYCLSMDGDNLQAKGETEQRLYLLNAWREAPLYTARERAALAWAEALTKISTGGVPDQLYAATRQEFTEEELVDLTMAINTINTYNRVNVAFLVQAGAHQPELLAEQAK